MNRVASDSSPLPTVASAPARRNRLERALFRLWGELAEGGRFHAQPRFAHELADYARGPLPRQLDAVSKWSYGHHVEHLYQACHWVFDRFHESMSGANADQRPNLKGQAFFVVRRFPRHWFPTIPPLEPQGGSLEQIEPLQRRLHERLVEIENLGWTWSQMLACRGRSRHPRMDWLEAQHWVFFLDVHHRHHGRILRDLERATA